MSGTEKNINDARDDILNRLHDIAVRDLSPNEKSDDGIVRRGLMLVLSSPSGAGKTTIARHLLDHNVSMAMSVSVTTRAMRPDEVDGRDYHFIQEDQHKFLVERGELLEHAVVFGNYYGTPKLPVEAALKSGRDVLFDIDWQGTQQLAANARPDLVTVFILPPSAAELERRLRTRNQDSADVIVRRMAKASSEMSHHVEYDYVIINHDLDESVRRIQTILDAERMKRVRQGGMIDFVRKIQQGC